MSFSIAAFYRFVALPDYQDLRPQIFQRALELGIKGTILLAAEGINATISGTLDNLEAFFAYLAQDERLQEMDTKWSKDENNPFPRLKVRLKKEIVTLGVPVDPTQKVGEYVAPENWNQLISDPDVLLIDTRNDYEVKVGTFKGAVDPKTQSFGEFPQYVKHNVKEKKRKIAMFCTGGIRCEKATSYMLDQGFEQVYHLKGGILNYLEKVPAKESLWEGECFVFDGRVAVENGVKIGHYGMCRGCGMPVTEEEQHSPFFEEGVTCPKCYTQRTPAQKARSRERIRQKAREKQLCNGQQ